MQAVQWLCGRLGRWVAAYRPELFCAVPLALLVLFGFYPAPWWAYAVLLIVLALAVLLCNPFRLWDGLLPPRARLLMAAGLFVALLPVSFYGVDLRAKLVLWALAAGLWAVALWRRRLWLGLYRVRQSPDVDAVLAHLAHDGDWEAGRAWERFGCRETRALLHQSIAAECDEGQMHRTYMPVYLLGYLHGKAAEQHRQGEAAQSRAELKRQARQLEEQRAEIAGLKADNTALSRKLAQAEHSADESWARAHVLEGRLEELQLDPAARDAAVLAYVNAGHSYTEAGAKYGLSKSGAIAAKKRAEQAAAAAS
ncbi:MAG: hypothetical protein LIO78_06855 [Clostridiales bacterium]|nr:hypothetical protein [Clostridiales bacterium]